MKKRLITFAVTAALLASTGPAVYASDESHNHDNNDQYIGAGIGAVTGALIAGPIGFVAGGVIGGLAAKHNTAASDEATAALVEHEPSTIASPPVDDKPLTQDDSEQSILIAQSGDLAAVIDNGTVEEPDVIEEILTTGITFDVFFLSGSTAMETFYQPQIQAIARLVQQLPDVHVHLDGYSDRRGDADQNLVLANQRLESVRDALELAGIGSDRIHLNAYGEQRFLSKPGDLEAYTFDRRVVIRFEHAASTPETPVALIDDASAE